MTFDAGGATAQDSQTKPRRIVALDAGGGNGNVARLLALGLTNEGGGRVIVENRGGASGVVAAETVIKAAPDGLTLLSISGSLWTLPLMQPVPYEPVQDLMPVTLAVSSPNILVVNPGLPLKTVRQLIALAKARPARGKRHRQQDLPGGVFLRHSAADKQQQRRHAQRKSAHHDLIPESLLQKLRQFLNQPL